MSRLIIKNLPKQISSSKLQQIFEAKGCVTNMQLKYTRDGVFRQFAFVGYKTEEEAIAAKDHFHNTFVNASRIQVEMCRSYGDPEKPKPWSKYSNKISETREQDAGSPEVVESKKDQKRKRKLKELQEMNEKPKVGDIPEELKNDAKFVEFLEVNKDRKLRPVWCDDTAEFKDGKQEEQDEINSANSDDKEEENSADDNDNRPPTKKRISDMEYLKSKMRANAEEPDDQSESTVVKRKRKHKKKVKSETAHQKMEKEFSHRFKVKLSHLPYSCKKKDIKAFFQPLKLIGLRIPVQYKGFAYVDLKNEKDFHIALNKNGGFLKGHRVSVTKYIKRADPNVLQKSSTENDQKALELESVAESGRIFVRNLCFTVTEEELKALFSKYGPVSEIHIPVDFYTKIGIGIAFITYLLPENAVKAFTELDHTDFQGRLLHLIAAKPKPENERDETDSSFKSKKKAKLDSLSKSSHNWNALFLGINAVADAISEKRGISKADLLSNDTKDSLPVRMAHAETELVMETRNFLLQQGIKLDAFSQATAERSKLVIIAKDLPAQTKPRELNQLFSKFGVVSRIIFPPSAITAIVVFQDESEAKAAYKKLAYSEFHHLPLFLEWAPMDIFDPNFTKQADDENQTEEKEMNEPDKGEEPEEKEYEPEEGTTLFVKNLNFETTEESLKKHFKNCGPLHSVSIAKKIHKKSGHSLSMGFGFVQFRRRSSALTALQDLQFSDLDGHSLQLKFSNRAAEPPVAFKRKKSEVKEQTGSKIVVRNIPFEATPKEIRELFQEYGEIKRVSVPKKPSGNDEHRGFGFVDFVTKAAAKRAFDVLCHSTHVLGRRLVLEWANTDSDDVSVQRKKTARDFYIGHSKNRVKKSKLLEDVMLAAPADD